MTTESMFDRLRAPFPPERVSPYYELQQGIYSARDQSIGWRTFADFDTRNEAMKEARKHKGYLWRIIESKVLWHSVEARNLMGGEPS